MAHWNRIDIKVKRKIAANYANWVNWGLSQKAAMTLLRRRWRYPYRTLWGIVNDEYGQLRFGHRKCSHYERTLINAAANAAKE